MADAMPLRTLEDRLRGARRAGFVGREAELELFRSALDAREPPFSVLWVHAPGGVGKTSLLSVLAEAAEARGRAPVRLDLRRVEPAPPAFLAELERVAGGSLEQWERPVLLLDTFEAASALEGWLRDSFLPGLPAGAIVVIAGRSRPGEEWRRDPGWRDLLRVIALRNLAPEEAREMLARAGVSGPAGDRLAAITHGHPLALSLLLDVRAQGVSPAALDDVPDIVAALVTGFLAGLPSPRHRRALEIVAHARMTTGGLLRRILGESDGHELLGWLRGLSFVESGPEGVFPHDLARDVIDADLRWRDPDAYAEVHRAVRGDVVERLTSAEGRDQQRALADLMYLHRGNPAAAALWDWGSLGRAYADAGGPADEDAVAALVERHEGPESAALARHWFRRRPGDFAIVRGSDPEPLGVIALLMLQETSEEDRAVDPLARAAWEHAHAHAPPLPGEEVMLGRFLVDRDAHQSPSPTLNLTTMVSTREWLRRPRLSWCYIACADPQAFAPLMAYIAFTRAEDVDAEVGGRKIAVFARDWRRQGGVAWLEWMGHRELGGDAPTTPPATAPELALSRPAFAEAVRDALRDLHRPTALARSPLARTRVGRDGDLRPLLEEAAQAATADPRDAKLARALDRTYLRPAPTQEAAAELLGLPFSTYRGHLTRGLERVTDLLWERELHGVDR